MNPARFRIPHTLVLLFALLVVAWACSWVLPQGSYRTVEGPDGRQLVVAGTYERLAARDPLPVAAVFTAVPRGLAAAADIVFFVLIVGGAIAVLRATGVIDAALGRVLARVGHRPGLLVVVAIAVFAAGASTLGISEEYIPLAATLVALCAAMRMDAIAAVATMVVGSAVGYGVATLNPFTVQVAQSVAGLQPVSGWELRLALFVPFVAIAAHHVLAYVRRVHADPTLSYLVDVPPVHPPLESPPPFDGRRRVVGLLVVATLVAMVWGIAARGWYLVELSGLFVGLGAAAGLAGGLGASGTARRFADGAAELALTALLIGFARAIALTLEDGQVLHTVVHALAGLLQQVGPHLAAVGMLLVQTAVNILVPSGSGQAVVTMPVMAPLADLLGIERQVAVLAFQFGDGFSNMIVPTSYVLMSILGIAGVPYDRWLRFALPLLGKLTLAAALVLVGAVAFDYG